MRKTNDISDMNVCFSIKATVYLNMLQMDTRYKSIQSSTFSISIVFAGIYISDVSI